MKGLFNYDNPVMRFIGKFWDVLILNILWMICSIPIITIGASTTAVYYVTLKLARDDDGYTFRSFFHSFKENFRQATIIWLIFLAIGVVLFCDLWFVITVEIVPAGTPRMVASALFIGMLIVWFVVLTYVFPVLARFYGTIKQTILNAFLLAFRYLLYTIAMVAVDIGIIYLTFTSLPVLSMLGFGLIAFLNSYFLQQIFKKYIPKEEPESEELRPLFADEETGENGEEPIYTMFVRNDTASPAEPAEPEALLGDAEAAETAAAETAVETGVTSGTGAAEETTPAESAEPEALLEDAEAAETAVPEGETALEVTAPEPVTEMMPESTASGLEAEDMTANAAPRTEEDTSKTGTRETEAVSKAAAAETGMTSETGSPEEGTASSEMQESSSDEELNQKKLDPDRNL